MIPKYINIYVQLLTKNLVSEKDIFYDIGYLDLLILHPWSVMLLNIRIYLKIY